MKRAHVGSRIRLLMVLLDHGLSRILDAQFTFFEIIAVSLDSVCSRKNDSLYFHAALVHGWNNMFQAFQ